MTVLRIVGVRVQVGKIVLQNRITPNCAICAINQFPSAQLFVRYITSWGRKVIHRKVAQEARQIEFINLMGKLCFLSRACSQISFEGQMIVLSFFGEQDMLSFVINIGKFLLLKLRFFLLVIC